MVFWVSLQACSFNTIVLLLLNIFVITLILKVDQDLIFSSYFILPIASECMLLALGIASLISLYVVSNYLVFKMYIKNIVNTM